MGSSDYCKDKTSPYDLRPEDAELFQTAIDFGERLSRHSLATIENRQAIAKMLEFLRNLPNPPPPKLHGEFGFMIVPDEGDGGHAGSWTVSVCRALLEIFCCGRDDLPEYSWELCPGRENLNIYTNAKEWIKQIGDPDSLITPGHHLKIEASTWSIVEDQ